MATTLLTVDCKLFQMMPYIIKKSESFIRVLQAVSAQQGKNL